LLLKTRVQKLRCPASAPGIFCPGLSWLIVVLPAKCGRKAAGDKKIERPFD
jgi:hypothetical protein